MNNLLLLPLLLLPLTFGLAIASWPLAKSIGFKFDIMDYPDHRKIHAVPTLRTGGLIIFFAYIAGLLLSGAYSYPECQPLALSAFSLFMLGLLEDRHGLGAKTRLFFQAGIVCFFLLSTGAVLKNLGLFAIPWFLQVPFTVFAVAGVINAFNIIDGMNGLSSGLGIIAAAFLGLLAFLQGDHEVFTLAVLFMGALAGFMVFNIRGKIFMGDSGSYLTGFVISALSVMLAVRNPGVSPFAPFLVVLIPVFDTLFAIYRRKKLKRAVFRADRRHLHHMLARRYKSNAWAVSVILLLQAGIALFAILLYGQTNILVGGAILFALLLWRLWFGRLGLAKVRWRNGNNRKADWFAPETYTHGGISMNTNHVVWHNGHVTRDERNRLNNHKSGLVWFTGLSASGKSTIAHEVERELFHGGIRCYVLDGDNVRHGINSNLSFSRKDRRENLRRIAEIAKLFSDSGTLCLGAFISPYKEDREYIRSCFNSDEFLEIYVKCSVEACERRDPKGLYKKARAGIIKNYTGISSSYEEPKTPDLVIDTEEFDIETSADMALELLGRRGFLNLEEEVEAERVNMVMK